MSINQQSMPPVPQYASSGAVASSSDTTVASSNTMNSTTDVSAGSAQANAGTLDMSSAAASGTGTPTATSAAIAGGALDWRDKDADRSARQQIARIILTLIMRSSNRPASVNYNPREIARRLEHTLYMSAASKEEYSNVQTLKVRLQQALDNSRRRQILQRQQQQQPATQQQQQQQQQGGVATMQTDMSTQQIQAQQLQQQQLQLLQRQQAQMAAQLQTQRNSFSGVPFVGSPGGIAQQQPQQVGASQPLQMPMSISQMPVSAPASMAMANTSTAPTTPGGTGNSILDELEREADEMANGVSDEPIAMPESELQVPAAIAMPVTSNFSSVPVSGAPANMVPSPSNGSFNAVPLSMPAEISGGIVGVTPSIPASSSFVQPTTSTMMAAAPAVSTGTNLYHGMNLTGPQIQQIQQIQQMQQLRRMQQMQQLQQQQQQQQQQQHQQQQLQHHQQQQQQQQQLAANAAAGMGVAQAQAVLGGTPRQADAPGMMPMNEASIAQKREELKRRLIQLKHARTCTAGDCTVDYCNRTKALLAHVSRCANAQCTTIGCKSTRQLLSHFRKCRNLQCDVCSAIRPPMNENEQQLVLRRQQERLCMLRHASTCALPQCVLPYCAGMKVLWKHICDCHQRQCRTDHCISSRYVLSHFKQCNKMICEVCGPVRKAIKIVDSCRSNPGQLQSIVSQCPDTVRGLIKIMNTNLQNAGSPGAGLASDSAHANQMKAGVNGGTPTAGKLQMDQVTGLQSSSANLSDGVVKLEANGGKMSVNAGAGNAHTTSLKSPSAGAIGATPSGVEMKALAAGDDSKKKPLKLQTEKEKKMRRKEQAKIFKARVQARAQAAATGGTPTSTPVGTGAVDAATALGTKKETPHAASTIQVLPNGLVVRGRTANLRNENHVNHQDISFLDSMTEGQLDEHIRSLRFNFCGHITLTELKNRLMPLLTKLMDSEYGWTFNNPVDPVQWNIPDYFDIIKCPMDLGTIKKRLENEHYNSVEAFAGDVRLVFENCIEYNSSTNKFNIAAKQLLSSFNKALASLKNQLEKQLFKRCEQRREEMCQLCGGESFKFAPCMLFCSGPCGGRIRRHTHYYSDPRGEHHWCSSCFKQMKDGPIDMSLLPQLSSAAVTEGGDAAGGAVAPLAPFDGVLKKSSLVKRKNSEVAEEPWVECDSCKLWYHQICALFNERNHAISGEQEPFVCPICVKKQRANGVKPSLENGLKARRLPITRMAKLIETRVLNAIATAHKEEAIRLGKMGNSDSIGFSSGVVESTSETQFGITIREVLSVDKQVQIKPKMGKLLAEHYGKSKKTTDDPGSEAQPKSLKRQRSGEGTKKKKQAQKNSTALSAGLELELTYRSRCICVFQELDGVDVLIFTLYVQEYGPDSLDPNAGRVYVSYLDSVNYFQPKKLRTLMHQHVMLGFLEDCKNRGFHTCHIWSCPPLKGDDYIFFCKPENQKIPKSARLRQWYQKLLQEAKKEGLVINMSNLYAEYYLKKKAAHELPYFEGDYWPRLAEDLIKQLEEKGAGGRSDKPGDDTASAGANASLPPSTSLPTAPDSAMGSGATTPVARSPTPSDASAQSDGMADDPPSAAATPTAAASKAGVNAKSKSKRTKKGAAAESSGTMTRSSASKARSKKGGKLGRANGSSKTVVNNDPLMQKLKGILEPQKDDFFVVDLHPKCHKCASPIVHVGYWELKTLPPPAEVTQLLEAAKKTRSSSSSARNSPPRHYHHYYCASCHEANKTQLLHRVEVAGNGAKRARDLSARILPLNEKAATAELAELDLQEVKFELSLEFVDPQQSTTDTEEAKKADSDEKAPAGDAEEKEPATEASGDQNGSDAAAKTDGDSNAPTSNPAESEKKTDEISKATDSDTSSPPAAIESAEKSTVSAGDKVDDDVIMPCEIFDTREAFLLYCQNNHCQFDQIRRAKHSSMMVLYHLFNQGTTGFTFNCTNCKITLLSGNRWNCSICPLFNLCDACNAKTKHEHTLHSFKVVAIPRLDDQPLDATAALTSAATGASTSAGMTREPGSSKLKRAKVADTKDPKGKKGVSGSGRKRKLGQAVPGQPQPSVLAAGATAASTTTAASLPASGSTPPAVSAAASGAASAAAPAPAAASSDTSGQTNGNGSVATSAEDAAKKQRRIHNIDPQLLVQLEHASSCTVPNCTFFNCARMQAMLKHGAICEQRLAGPCVLCKRIVGLLSAHARQCTKEYAECKVPRCGDIRRHFLQQMQQRQQQLLLARQQQQQLEQQAAASVTDAAKDAAG